MNLLYKKDFEALMASLISRGYGEEISWQRDLKECETSSEFANEAIWVILNSGMKEQIARKIYNKISDAISANVDISTVFGHAGKVAAIKHILANHANIFTNYCLSEDKIAYLQTIPFIGKITCYHLAKNLGHDCVKPDRHLVRIAGQYNLTPVELCEKISVVTGEKKCVVDIIIWRACNLNIL